MSAHHAARCSAIVAAVAAAISALSGCADEETTPARVLRISGEGLWVELELDRGAVRFGARGDDTVVQGMHLAVVHDGPAGPQLATSLGRPMPCELEQDRGRQQARCTVDLGTGIAAELEVELDDDQPGQLGWHTVFRNRSDGPLGLRKLLPFRATAAEGGAVLLGDDAATVRILQNGRDELVDFYVDLLRGDQPLSDPDAIPLLVPYSSFSNGSALAHDLAGGASLLAGFLELDWAFPLVAFAGSEEGAAPVAGRVPMTDLVAEARYPHPVSLAAGDEVDGGQAVFLLGQATPFDALERYADELARHHEVDLPEQPTAGWDSWYTSFEHDEIDEAFIQANADGLASELAPYGLDSMQIDLGWQDSWGDWQGSAGFPSGMQAMASYIRDRGIQPELWIAPLSAEESSAVYQQHQDEWFVGKNPWGEALMDPDMHPLDLTRQDVIDHIRALGQRVRDWGYESVKLDFAYYALVSEFPPDPYDTPTALYRRAVQAFRSGVGEETYFINISASFPNYGLVDAFRIGLDDWPCWNGGADCEAYGAASGIGAQGIKPAVRTAARRYWLNGRIWYNHLDQLFFRDLSLTEARTFATLVGVAGGMIALGEDMASLGPAELDIYRRILPLTGATARPVDLLRTEYPEIWHLPLGAEWGGAHLLGLFHWGANLDHRTHGPTERADGRPLVHEIDLAALGLDPATEYVAYGFWRGELLRSATGQLSHELEPHSAEVIKLIPRPDQPTFLATNRHVLMGPQIVSGLRHDSGVIAGTVRSAPGFEQTLVFWLPEGVSVVSAAVDGAGPVGHQEPQPHLAVVSFTGQDADEHPFEVGFE